MSVEKYPLKPPKLTLYGDVGHCHVFNSLHGLYRICFSLDESFQWYFKGEEKQLSGFNPSVSIKYYIISVYKFLAEDDRVHDVTDKRKIDSVEYWRCYEYKSEQVPERRTTYKKGIEELLRIKLLNTSERERDEVKKRYRMNIPKEICDMRDYVDKDVLLLSGEPIVYGVKKYNNEIPCKYDIVGFDLMKWSTFRRRIRKTSTGREFNTCAPLVIHSYIWERVKSIKVLDRITETFKTVNERNMIMNYRQAGRLEHYLYIVLELFNNLAESAYTKRRMRCEEIVRGFYYLHHLLLLLLQKESLRSIVDEMKEYFYTSEMNRSEEICPKIGVFMGLLIVDGRDGVNESMIIMEEIIIRGTVKLLLRPLKCTDVINYDEEELTIYDIKSWLELLWDEINGMCQRLAFQIAYNEIFDNETLETIDSCYGMMTEKSLILLMREIKYIYTLSKKNGLEEFERFIRYKCGTKINMNEKMRKIFDDIVKNKLHYDILIIKCEWEKARNN